MEQRKLWSRMKGWISSRSREDAVDGGGSASGQAGQPGDGRADVTALSRRRRNEIAIERLQDGYDKVVELIDSIQKHQQQQEARAVEISSSLAQVAQALETIESTDERQGETLGRIADELRSANERAAEWGQAVSRLPPIVESQRESLEGLNRHMEALGQRDEHLTESLGSFREVVSSLSDATTASSVAIKSLQMSTIEGDERIAALMREQNKRFNMLFGVTLALVVIAILFVSIAWWR
jgi:chromosome segregation ATPase